MVQYIDKDALVAEIEKRINFNEKLNAHSRLDECNAILSFIDTLEVKEVNFDKELSEVWRDWANEYDISFVSYKKIAKYFFELGMQVSNKAQKGEEL